MSLLVPLSSANRFFVFAVLEDFATMQIRIHNANASDFFLKNEKCPHNACVLAQRMQIYKRILRGKS